MPAVSVVDGKGGGVLSSGSVLNGGGGATRKVTAKTVVLAFEGKLLNKDSRGRR